MANNTVWPPKMNVRLILLKSKKHFATFFGKHFLVSPKNFKCDQHFKLLGLTMYLTARKLGHRHCCQCRLFPHSPQQLHHGDPA